MVDAAKAETDAARVRRGRVRFVLLHHSSCNAGAFHYAIHADGRRQRLLPETERGQHAGSIGVVVEGDFDDRPPSELQIATLEDLLVELKLRYPEVVVGAHRQVRRPKAGAGSITTCPGRRFPMKRITQWSRTDMLRLRDEKLAADVEAQYLPRS